MVARPSSSSPSSTSPYIPSRCHLTTDQSTLIGIVCFCTIVLVDSPVKSRRSFGSSKVYEKSLEMSKPLTEVPCSGRVSARDPIACRRQYAVRMRTDSTYLDRPFRSERQCQLLQVPRRMYVDLLSSGRVGIPQSGS
jgi:hypothetical protein